MVFLLLMGIVQPQDGGKEILPEIRLVFLSHRVLSPNKHHQGQNHVIP